MSGASKELAHRPVLLDEALAALAIGTDGIYVDGTYGRGGHTGEILQRLGPHGHLLAIDKDPDAIAAAQARFGHDPRFAIERGSFAKVREFVAQRGWIGRVRGLLLDLGVSSPQLDDARRGFSFQLEGPLDMRMDPHAGESAAQWLAHARETDIAQVLRDYGDERFAKRIARAIVHAREQQPIVSTLQLADVISGAVRTREPGKHPATRSFQALRIYVNNELSDLRAALESALDVLAVGGRLVVISFHSLEDRIVKQFMRDKSRGDDLPRGLPVTQDQIPPPRMLLAGKPVFPGDAEVEGNPRARSAVLRVAEKLT